MARTNAAHLERLAIRITASHGFSVSDVAALICVPEAAVESALAGIDLSDRAALQQVTLAEVGASPSNISRYTSIELRALVLMAKRGHKSLDNTLKKIRRWQAERRLDAAQAT